MRAASLRLAMRPAPHMRPAAAFVRPTALRSRPQPQTAVPSSLLLRPAAAKYATEARSGQQQVPPQAPPPPSQGDGKKFGMKNSTLFTVLIGVGLLMTIYGV